MSYYYGSAAANRSRLPSLAVNVGADQEITLPADASINATVSGGAGGETVLWTEQSGPGTVTFAPNATTVDVTADFSIDGTYVLRLTATDGVLSVFDELQVVVNPISTGGWTPPTLLTDPGAPNVRLVWNNGSNASWPTGDSWYTST